MCGRFFAGLGPLSAYAAGFFSYIIGFSGAPCAESFKNA